MTFKCVVCLEKNEFFPYRPLIQGTVMRVCSQECYNVFCAEYEMCKYEVKIKEIKERLEAYRIRREELKK